MEKLIQIGFERVKAALMKSMHVAPLTLYSKMLIFTLTKFTQFHISHASPQDLHKCALFKTSKSRFFSYRDNVKM